MQKKEDIMKGALQIRYKSHAQKEKLLTFLVLLVALSLFVLCMHVVILQRTQQINIRFDHHINLSDQALDIDVTVDINQQYNSLHKLKTTTAATIQNNIESECTHEIMQLRKEGNGTNYYNKNKKEITTYLSVICKKSTKQTTCAKYTKGMHVVNTTVASWEGLQLSHVYNGGWWQPQDCKSLSKVAVIIPYRNREKHLKIFLQNLHPFLFRQHLHYRIFVIEQIDESPFNRGKLFNVGFKEALKFFPYTCFVFHDVDLIPENNLNTYDCITSPQHLTVAVDKFNYRLIYEELFGGVELFTKSHFELVNGFSNSFWGWGAEDDNLYQRLLWKKLPLWRQSHNIGKYKMLSHRDAEPAANPKRQKILEESKNYFVNDGLSSLQYEVREILQKQYHTHIRVDLRIEKDKMFGVKEFPK